MLRIRSPLALALANGMIAASNHPRHLHRGIRVFESQNCSADISAFRHSGFNFLDFRYHVSVWGHIQRSVWLVVISVAVTTGGKFQGFT